MGEDKGKNKNLSTCSIKSMVCGQLLRKSWKAVAEKKILKNNAMKCKEQETA